MGVALTLTNLCADLIFGLLTLRDVPVGSPSRGGDVMVYVIDIKQPSLPTLFILFLCLCLSFKALSPVFNSINSPDNSPLSDCSAGLISALLVLSTTYLFTKVSLSPDIILCGWLGLKHQLTNQLTLRDIFIPFQILSQGWKNCLNHRVLPVRIWTTLSI